MNKVSEELFYFFADNRMKANPDKCHLLPSSSDKVGICVDNKNIKSIKCKNILGIKIDNKLNVNTHFEEICKKTGQKLNVLSTVPPYVDLSKRGALLNVFLFVVYLLFITLDVS